MPPAWQEILKTIGKIALAAAMTALADYARRRLEEYLEEKRKERAEAPKLESTNAPLTTLP